ncbi:uncharacterized protein LOC116950970 isoform X2 [Petromyzon marinus]|uniref:Uncharacterized protein LOC116950970 isoform X2 n=1 Tax=Petromyzon marinus TaxID=7757 RepID=A0AAJ7TW08_PETMA|nr:uncharacterized protein LOC116950970 isoform X2 [Petromyzon marinus]
MEPLKPLRRLATRPLSTREPTKRKFDFAVQEQPQVEEEPPDTDAVEKSSTRQSAHLQKQPSVSTNDENGSMTLMLASTHDYSEEEVMMQHSDRHDRSSIPGRGRLSPYIRLKRLATHGSKEVLHTEISNSAKSTTNTSHPEYKKSLQRTPQILPEDDATTSSARKVPTAELASPNLNNSENSPVGTTNQDGEAMGENPSESRGSESKTVQPTPPDNDEDVGESDRDSDEGDLENAQERMPDLESASLEQSGECEIQEEAEGMEGVGTLIPHGHSSKKARILEEEEVEQEVGEVDYSIGKILKKRVSQKLGPTSQTPANYGHKSGTQSLHSGPARRSFAVQRQQPKTLEKLRPRRRTRDHPSSEGSASMIKLRTVRVCVGERKRGVRQLTALDVILTYIHNVLESYMEEVTSEECVAFLQELHKNLQVEFDNLALKSEEWKKLNSKSRRVELDLVRIRKKILAMRMEKERLRQEALELGDIHDLALADAATTLESLSNFYKTEKETRGQRMHGEEEEEEEVPSSLSSLLVDAHLVLSGAQNLASMNARLENKLSTR